MQKETKNKTKTLNTKRLTLQTPTPDDAKHMLDYVLVNREHLAPWEPIRKANYFTIEHWEEQFQKSMELYQQGREFAILIRSKEDTARNIIGQCRLSNIVRGAFQASHLGYSLAEAEQGKGLMNEALTEVIRYAFEEMHLHRVMANYIPENQKSEKVLKKLGFTKEGYAKDYLFLAGKWQDHILTSLVHPNWSPEKLG